MEAFLNGFLFVFLAMHQTQAEHFQQGVWREVFTVNVVAPGANFSTAAGSKTKCALHCLQLEDCKTSAFHQHSATCWLYRHLVEYTTTGMASPGTGYFWRLSPSCPGELGYQLEAGVCLKVYNPKVNRTEAEARCREDGAHLLIADSSKKIQAVHSRTSLSAWLGASDKDKEGDWRWVDGSEVQDHLWAISEPNNANGKEHFMELPFQQQPNDGAADVPMVPVCQIPSV